MSNSYSKSIIKSMIFTVLLFLQVQASTVSIMSEYVAKERIAGERRMDALFAKKTEALCPGYNQKGMSLCVRQYIKNSKIETSSAYAALTHFVAVSSNQDRNAKIYDEASSMMIEVETLLVLQDQLRKENMVCAKLQPSGARHLLEVKQVCEQEESQILSQQTKNKKYIQKQLLSMQNKIKTLNQPNVKLWITQKMHEAEKAIDEKFNKSFFNEEERRITAKDILQQHKLTLQTSCEKLSPEYKSRFNKQNPCELIFSQIFLSCVDMPGPKNPMSIKDKQITEMVQKPLPCFYSKMQEYLTSHEKSPQPMGP